MAATDPGRAELERLIRATAGNVARMAALLGASRPSVYTWIWKHGLNRLAGVDSKARQVPESVEKYVKSPGRDGPTFQSMDATLPADAKMARTVQLTEDIWLWTRMYALRSRRHASDVAEEALRRFRLEIEGKPPETEDEEQ